MIAGRLFVVATLLVSWQGVIAAAEAAPAMSPVVGGFPVGSAAALFSGKAVSKKLLATQRGGTETAEGITLSGSIANTTTNNVATGANAISDGAFAGSTGLPTVIQNSGNNVLIQTSTIINITVK